MKGAGLLAGRQLLRVPLEGVRAEGGAPEGLAISLGRPPAEMHELQGVLADVRLEGRRLGLAEGRDSSRLEAFHDGVVVRIDVGLPGHCLHLVDRRLEAVDRLLVGELCLVGLRPARGGLGCLLPLELGHDWEVVLPPAAFVEPQERVHLVRRLGDGVVEDDVVYAVPVAKRCDVRVADGRAGQHRVDCRLACLRQVFHEPEPVGVGFLCPTFSADPWPPWKPDAPVEVAEEHVDLVLRVGAT